MTKRNYPDRAPQIRPEVAIKNFKEVIKKIYKKWGLDLPQKVYLSDSAVEAEIGVPGVRLYNTSDIDILFAEPDDMALSQISQIETEIRDCLAESGVDFNYAPESDLERGDAYGRVCKLLPNFQW